MLFTAQKGVEYTIFAQSPDEQAGTIVLNWWAGSSCGNDGTSLVGSSDETGLREAVFDDPDPGAPAYVLAGPNASIWYWMTDDTVTQSLYVSTDGSVSVRTFYDMNGLPHKVLNECSGDWIQIQRYDAENVDFWFYGADGNYQSGLAVFEDEGSYYYAEIDGVPVHAGKRITGFLRPTGESWTGSYTLEVHMSDIQDAQPVPREIAAFMDSLNGGRWTQGHGPGWRSRFAAILGPFSSWLWPGVAVAGGHEGIIHHTLVLGGLGMLAKGVGIAVAGGVAVPAVAVAGAVTLTAGLFTPDFAQGLRERCDSGSIGDGCRAAHGFLAHPDARGPIGFTRDLVGGATDRITTWINRGKQALGSIGSFFNPPTRPQAKDEPIRRIPDGTPSETITGMTTDGATTVDVAGTVTSAGDFDVEDEYGAARIEGSLGSENTTTITGTFELNGDSGSIIGSTGGRPIQIKPIPDWKAPVGAVKTIDLSQRFESANDGKLTYGTTSNKAPDVASARVSGSILTLQARQAGITTISVTAWHFVDGTSTTDTVQIQVTGSSETGEEDRDELEALLAEIEEDRRKVEEAARLARQAAGELDGASTADGDTPVDGGTPTVQFRTTDACDDGQAVHSRLFQRAQAAASGTPWAAQWPKGQSNVYVTQSYNVENGVRVSCPSGQLVCYGAESADGGSSWGVGLDGNEGCSSCCRNCPNSGQVDFRVDPFTCDAPARPSGERSKSRLSFSAYYSKLGAPFAGPRCREFLINDLAAYESSDGFSSRAEFEAHPDWDVYDGLGKCPTGGTGCVDREEWGAFVTYYYAHPDDDQIDDVAYPMSFHPNWPCALTGVVHPSVPTDRIVPWPPES